MARTLAPRKPARLLRAELREDIVRGFATLPEGELRVDRDKGIVRGVKVVGRSSPNNHKIKGATEGTEYTLEALQVAAPLYEGVAVFTNHPPREKPDKEREVDDALGELFNVRVTDDGMYADLKVMKVHPMAERVFEAAESFPRLFGLSHNAYGEGEVRARRYVITQIPLVHSVDLVTRPATTNGLFESKEPAVKKTVKQVLESLAAKLDAARKPKLIALLEDDVMAPAMAAEMDEPAADVDPMDALKDGFRAALMVAIDNALDGDEAALKQVSDLIKTHRKITAKPEPKEEASTEESEEDDDEEGKPKSTPESRAARKAPKGTAQLTERAKALCTLAGIEPAAPLLESLTAMGSDAAITKHLTWLKTQTGKPSAPAKGPRSQSPGVPTLESKAADAPPAKPGELAGWLRR